MLECLLIHGYFGVNVMRVWEIVRKDILDLRNNIAKVKEDLKKQQEDSKLS